MNDQRSLVDQLRALYDLANKHRLYDAADFVKGHVEAVERREADAAIRDAGGLVKQRMAAKEV